LFSHGWGGPIRYNVGPKAATCGPLEGLPEKKRAEKKPIFAIPAPGGHSHEGTKNKQRGKQQSTIPAAIKPTQKKEILPTKNWAMGGLLMKSFGRPGKQKGKKDRFRI